MKRQLLFYVKIRETYKESPIARLIFHVFLIFVHDKNELDTFYIIVLEYNFFYDTSLVNFYLDFLRMI